MVPEKTLASANPSQWIITFQITFSILAAAQQFQIKFGTQMTRVIQDPWRSENATALNRQLSSAGLDTAVQPFHNSSNNFPHPTAARLMGLSETPLFS
ncbi:hypothetical protein N7451_004805 [Penicillium sp. IBT 35674x]|nr:hypothetical protein N7451_004805 [Penicillium sp. IBT 35674x]